MPIQNEHAWYTSYDDCQRKYAALKHWWNRLHLRALRFSAHVPAEARIVDIGCGDGNLLRTLASLGHANLHGFDLRLPPAWDEGLCLQPGSMLAMPYADHFADALICFNVMHHLLTPRDDEVFLTECRRVLRPGCPLFLVEPHRTRFRRVHDWILRIPVLSEFGPIKAQKITVLAEHAELERFMDVDIVDLVSRHGFSVGRYRPFLKSFLLHAVAPEGCKR